MRACQRQQCQRRRASAGGRKRVSLGYRPGVAWPRVGLPASALGGKTVAIGAKANVRYCLRSSRLLSHNFCRRRMCLLVSLQRRHADNYVHAAVRNCTPRRRRYMAPCSMSPRRTRSMWTTCARRPRDSGKNSSTLSTNTVCDAQTITHKKSLWGLLRLIRIRGRRSSCLLVSCTDFRP